MNTDLVDGKYDLAELFCQRAAALDPLAAAHLHVLQSGPVPGVVDSVRGRKMVHRSRMPSGNRKRLVLLPDSADIVQQIHAARARFGSVAASPPLADSACESIPSLNLSSLEIFVEGVAHHFNNRFMAIQGYVSLLLREIDPDIPGLVHLQRTEKLVHCESILANDLLQFLIGRPYRINDHSRHRLLRRIDDIACFAGAKSNDRRADQGSYAALNPTERILRNLSGSVACILGRLLSDIQEQSALFASRIDSNARVFQRLQKITELSRQGLQAVCQLLGYAGYTALPNGHRIARSRLIETVRRSFSGKKTRIRLFMDVDEGLPKIKLQHRQLVQILNEVLNNAADAMTDGGDLYFAAANLRPEEIDEPGWNVPAKHFIRLTVRDSGCGFNPQTGRLIFEPFFTNKSREGHCGLGLSSIYGIVSTLGGYIGVKTEPGRGTVFHIYLPSEKENLSKNDKTGAAAPLTTGRQVIHRGNSRRRIAGSRVLENT